MKERLLGIVLGGLALAVASLSGAWTAVAQTQAPPPGASAPPPVISQPGGSVRPPAGAVNLPDQTTAGGSVRPPGMSVEGPVGFAPAAKKLGHDSTTDLWRGVREGQGGNVVFPSREAGILIQSEGEDWRVRRNEIVARYGGQILLGILGLLAVYFLVRGRIRISGGRSGRVIPRFTLGQRIAHWMVAALFVLLGVSGLILLFGKSVLMPVIGKEAFALVASASLQGHNLFGPIFIPAILALFVLFLRGNGYGLVDLKWLVKGGGLFGGHASSHKYNFGEKTWFWLSVALGIVLSASGVVLLFPDALADRALAQLANLAHAISAVLFIGVGLGHAYLGTIGMEGALEGMARGTVDENWAKDHHDLWYEEHKRQATTDARMAEVRAAAVGDAALRGAGS
ncbi:MAG: formate dehydrogenase subunit gamma [Pseudomonadota bacterium]